MNSSGHTVKVVQDKAGGGAGALLVKQNKAGDGGGALLGKR